MARHFLLSAKARTLSLAAILRMTDDQAHAAFVAIRWADNGGEAFCPRCECTAVYTYAARRIWKCKACNHQFSVTSGTIFASRKLPIRDLLAAIAIFVNAAKGLSALQLGRDLDVQYKTAFVLAHKLREAIGAGQASAMLSGHVEVDGAYFGGSVRQENRKEDRKDRRLAQNQTGKRQVVVVMRERGGRTLPFVFRAEADAIPTIRDRVATGTTIYADEAASWDALHARFETKRINHSIAFSDDGACTNQAESYFSRLRRAEWGQHHHISGKYLGAYAGEMAWREDTRRQANGVLHQLAAAALGHGVSRVWAGYWQRGRA
ncbi:IS1595 family transposase [Roseomonas nepalensis]|uniref:IS1595 family transposase n=1 Tax=Muricoccus nepalensis TaxID=1854500 RepID=A0A502EN92_9PROT|nr:IS1595 family transposase [Roseomonas nepalensis]TPG38554.1 IS1595 family transposase [Roseomonas nepalensis]